MSKKIIWSGRAKANLGAINEVTALRILHALARVLSRGEGDVKRLNNIEPPESVSVSGITASASMILAIPSRSSP